MEPKEDAIAECQTIMKINVDWCWR